MTQCELERELADLTGESLGTIRSRGFSVEQPPDLEPLVVDWDQIQNVELPRGASGRIRPIRRRN